VSFPSAGARVRAGTSAFRRSPVGRPARSVERPLPVWAFIGVAVASFGGPLALAAQIAPGTVSDAASSAGFAMVAAVVVFAAPLAIWLRYSATVAGSGGLFAFVEAAAGRRVALVQAAIWTVSYLLYVIYTTVQIVYDLLPIVLPGERQYQTLLALLIPVAVAGVMIAGRAVAMITIGLIAGGQLILAGVLDGVTLAHLSTPVSSFGVGAPAGALRSATAQTSLLYICGSLPVFLGGELATPARTIRRGLIGVYLLTALVVVLAVAPLAAAPGLTRTEIPGFSVAQQFAGLGLARAIGIGVAASTAGVILCEYLALTRLLHAVGSWRLRPITIAVGVIVVAAAPFSLIDPDGFYTALVKPSLAALWLSQLIVFAVYPLFARKRGQPMVPAWALSIVAGGLAVYGLWLTLQQTAS
jgi:amino acid transporter